MLVAYDAACVSRPFLQEDRLNLVPKERKIEHGSRRTLLGEERQNRKKNDRPHFTEDNITRTDVRTVREFSFSPLTYSGEK